MIWVVHKIFFYIITLVLLSKIFSTPIFATETFQKIPLTTIYNDPVARARYLFRYGDNVIYGSNNIPFSIPEFNNTANNFYNSTPGPVEVNIDTSIDNATNVYILFAGSGTNKPLNTLIAKINLTFSDSSVLSTNLNVGFNIREWILNDTSYTTTTSDLVNTEEVWRGITPEGNGPTIADLLTIPITSPYNNKKIVKIGFQALLSNAGFHILGVTVKTIIPVEPNPVVFIPGFGGSWSYKGLIENQTTTYADWELMPFFTDGIYQPLLTTLKNAGSDPLIFAYDFRSSITDSANSLNTFLTDKTPSKKANIITHSMGSLIVRYCYEKVTGCASKIDKIATTGGPHSGTLAAYPVWEAGKLDLNDIFVKTAAEIALHEGGYPYLTNKDIVQNRFPGVRDLLPMNLPKTKNIVLESLFPISTNFFAKATTFSGNKTGTPVSFETVPLSRVDKALGLWIDGKPSKYNNDFGDGTVLKSSSQIVGAQNKDYDLSHGEYFTNTQVLKDVLEVFSLIPGIIVTNVSRPTSMLSFLMHSPVTIQVKDHDGNLIGTNVDGKAVFISDPEPQNFQIILTGTDKGSFQLDSVFTSVNMFTKKTFNGILDSGQNINLNFNFSPDSSQGYTNENQLLSSFLQKSFEGNILKLRLVAKKVEIGLRHKEKFDLSKYYFDCINILSDEGTVEKRIIVTEACEQLFSLVSQDNDFSKENQKFKYVGSDFENEFEKKTISKLDALNWDLSQEFIDRANILASNKKYVSSKLLFSAAKILIN